MVEPNPIWGIQLTSGVALAALVRRTDDGFVVEATAREECPHDEDELVDAVVKLLEQKRFRGRPAMVALPDTDACLVSATIPTEQLYLDEDELYRELFEYTPFDPYEAQLVYRRLGSRDDRTYLVAAMTNAELERRASAIDALDPAFHAITQAGAAMTRGLAGLGLRSDAVVVELQPRLTVLYGPLKQGVRRYILPFGEHDVVGDAACAAALARDIVRTAEYHAEQTAEADDETSEEATHDVRIALAGDAAARVRDALAPELGAQLITPESNGVPPSGNPPSGNSPSGNPLAGNPVPGKPVRGKAGPLGSVTARTYAGAIGAALEAFAPPEERLVLRHPPTSVPPPPRDSGAKGLLIGAAALAAAAVAVVTLEPFGSGDGDHAAEANGNQGTAVSTSTPAFADAEERVAAWVAKVRRQHSFAVCVAGVARLVEAAGDDLVTRSIEIEPISGAYRATLIGRAPGGATPELRSSLREAAEWDDRLRNISVATPEGSLRIRFDVDPVSPGSRHVPEDDGEIEFLAWPDDWTRAGDGVWTATSNAEGALAKLAGATDPDRTTAAERLSLRVADDGSVVLRVEASQTVSDVPPPRSEADAHRARRAADRATADAVAAAPALVVPAPTATSAAIDVTSSTPARAELSFAAAETRRRLDRRGNGGAWQPATIIEPGVTGFADAVTGSSGRYEWRLVAPDAAANDPTVLGGAAEILVPVTVELTGRDADGRATFVLTRPDGRGNELVATLVCAVGDGVATRVDYLDTAYLVDSGYVVKAIRTTIEVAQETVRVPAFEPDGTVTRDTDGGPVVTESVEERQTRVLTVEAEGPGSSLETWVRKMTDG